MCVWVGGGGRTRTHIFASKLTRSTAPKHNTRTESLEELVEVLLNQSVSHAKQYKNKYDTDFRPTLLDVWAQGIRVCVWGWGEWGGGGGASSRCLELTFTFPLYDLQTV